MAFRNEKLEKYSAAAGSKELNDMKKESETEAIEKWLKAVDKPLPTKHGSKTRRKAKRRAKQ
jgi:hypothetical protein